jgi:hypothetical protein
MDTSTSSASFQAYLYHRIIYFNEDGIYFAPRPITEVLLTMMVNAINQSKAPNQHLKESITINLKFSSFSPAI